MYAKDMDVLISSSSEQVQCRIRAIQKKCEAKSLTEAGLDRKKRIEGKVFYQPLETELHLSSYTHILSWI